MLDELRADAVKALGAVLRDTSARPGDRLRAAEAILRADRDGVVDDSELLALSDRALLEIAQEGGTPPEMGPRDSSAGAVPSHAHAQRSEIPPPGLALPANPFMRKRPKGDPKEDPSREMPGGLHSAEPEPWM